MSESEYVTAIINEIEKLGGKAVKFVETEYSEKGTPDIIGCVNGQCVLVEAKVDNNLPSKIQQQRMQEWDIAGAITLYAFYPKVTAYQVALAAYNLSKLPLNNE